MTYVQKWDGTWLHSRYVAGYHVWSHGDDNLYVMCKNTRPLSNNSTRFGEVCSCCTLSLLPQLLQHSCNHAQAVFPGPVLHNKQLIPSLTQKLKLITNLKQLIQTYCDVIEYHPDLSMQTWAMRASHLPNAN